MCEEKRRLGKAKWLEEAEQNSFGSRGRRIKKPATVHSFDHLFLCLSAVFILAPCAQAEEPEPATEESERELPLFDAFATEGYRTPRSGEGFRTEVFGESITVDSRDRRSVSTWDLAVSAVAPGVTKSEVVPLGSLYFWRRPDENRLFRGLVAGIFNQLEFAESTDALGPWEGVATFESRTIPWSQAEYVDGERIRTEELIWGDVHLGLGVGYRRQLDDPGENDNMFSVALTAEPGWLYFWSDSSDTADDFVDPQDTFEIRGRLRVRLDKLERNLLELAHSGFVFGSDLVAASRGNWKRWGRNERENGAEHKEYIAFSGYAAGATGVPFVDSERHRLIGSVHGGTGRNLDRFSRFRVGGGPQEAEYDAISHPVLPGAFFNEFLVSNYAVITAEYRWEPVFFAYLSLRSSVSYLDRRRNKGGRIRNEDDVLFSIGPRITSGFFFNTRLQIDYSYNAGVIRDDEYGGHEIMIRLSGLF